MGVPLDVLDPEVGRVQKAGEQHLALEVLVRDVELGLVDVESCVAELAEQTPCVAVWLPLISEQRTFSKHRGILVLTMESKRFPLPRICNRYISGLSE